MKNDVAMPAFSIGKSKRNTVMRKDLDLKKVGPGSYTPGKTLNLQKSPEFTMGSRFKLGSALS